jgi:hypothetical protein
MSADARPDRLSVIPSAKFKQLCLVMLVVNNMANAMNRNPRSVTVYVKPFGPHRNFSNLTKTIKGRTVAGDLLSGLNGDPM